MKEPWHFSTLMTVENSHRSLTFHWSIFWSSLDGFNIGMKYSISDTDLVLKEALFSNLYLYFQNVAVKRDENFF
jgi:hypothetical protein